MVIFLEVQVMARWARLLWVLLLVAALGACDAAETTPAPRAERSFSVAMTLGRSQDYETPFRELEGLGMKTVELPLSWDELERAEGVYVGTNLDIALQYYGPRKTRIVLELNPIDTNNLRVPSYLDGAGWQGEERVAAYEKLLDWALGRLAPLDIVLLVIGNEVDGSLANDADWEAYRRFVERAAAHARKLRPDLLVGSKLTYGGITGPWAEQAAALVATGDVALVTYYPLGAGFRLLDPGQVEAVMADMVERFPDRPIYFAELGMPVSPHCGGSPELQASFYRHVFAAWDRFAGRIPYIQFVWLHDISPEELAGYETYYGISDRCFLEYLGTLGLKDYDGTPRPAWEVLREELGKRTW